MPMIKQTTVYKFDELSDEAKERARDWWRTQAESDSDYSDGVIDDAVAVAACLGIEFRTKPVKLFGGGTKHEPVVYWSGFSSQGDGACFEGSYRYAKGSVQKIRAYAPADTKLHAIAETLMAAQKSAFYRLMATMEHSGHYYHSGCMRVEVEYDHRATMVQLSDWEETVTQAMRDFADWIYHQLEQSYEWHMGRECVDEALVANAYDFDEQGRIQ